LGIDFDWLVEPDRPIAGRPRSLARDTHKFESRYLDWLIGPYPQEEARYRERSPVYHADRLAKPVIFFQGEEDAVVPPNQAESMVEALRRKGNPVGYFLFSGEQHGFRKAGNIQRCLDAELAFYAIACFGGLRPELPNGSEIRYHSRHFRSHLEKSWFTGRGVPLMCDYSLHHVASRPANVGDKLVTTQFNHSITRGFAAVGEPNVAVCLLPGTEVAFEKEVEFERGFGLFSSWTRQKRIGDKVARFRQLNADKPNMHHDALEFPDGEILLVTRLCEGQHATVLQLPASPHSVKDEVERKHADVVG
jgi:hypothetical protein